MNALPEINVFWFKRDLRLFDNEALQNAISSSKRILLIYLYEPKIWGDDHYDIRHYNFVKESLSGLDAGLENNKTKILAVQSEIIPFFEKLSEHYKVHSVFSTEETGLKVTFRRDIDFSKYCSENGIQWFETQNNGVVRGIRNRNEWRKLWYGYMNTSIKDIDFSKASLFSLDEVNTLAAFFLEMDTGTESHNFQKGGRKDALRWKNSFFEERLAYYSDYISKPEKARYGCSRLSPYFAWGNLSIREVFQEAMALKKTSDYKRQLNAFLSRLRWQSHFIQKFEMEPRMEFSAINKGFLALEYPLNETYVKAWKEGKTGYPLVDASMRCLVQTGYVNFRMRSMVVSFLTHHLFQHFTTGGAWLARQFLDFEPGIHYGQMQMQAGLTGINTVRVYNPVKNALDHDSEAVFIKKYVPELRELPVHLVIEPWNTTAMEQQLYAFDYGTIYPKRIVDIKETRKHALDKLYYQRKNELAQNERQRILGKHTMRRK